MSRPEYRALTSALVQGDRGFEVYSVVFFLL